MLLFNQKKMKNKFLAIFLGTIISLLLTNHCFALNAPTDTGVISVGEGSAILTWEWEEGGGTIKQFKLLWREETASSTEDWVAKYPTATGDSPYEYSLRGLEAGTSYEWRIKAEAESTSQDSSFADGVPFETDESQWEEENPEEGEEGGEGTAPTITSPFENIGNIQEAADAFTEFLVITGFAVGPILIIYAAFLLLTKQGDPTATAQAKKIILWTIISLSIMLFAKGIPSVVKDLFK